MEILLIDQHFCAFISDKTSTRNLPPCVDDDPWQCSPIKKRVSNTVETHTYETDEQEKMQIGKEPGSTGCLS